ncbi:hypothetical protein LRE75_29390 [Streptomyces sp. 372A]
MRIRNWITVPKDLLVKALDCTPWVKSRRLHDDLAHAAVHCFYKALDEIHDLHSQLGQEHAQRIVLLERIETDVRERRALNSALAAFGDQFDDRMLAISLAEKLGAEEVAALAHLLTEIGRKGAADMWLELHNLAREDDDVEDAELVEAEAA